MSAKRSLAFLSGGCRRVNAQNFEVAADQGANA